MDTGAGQENLSLSDRIRITKERLSNLEAGAGKYTRREREQQIAYQQQLLNALWASAREIARAL